MILMRGGFLVLAALLTVASPAPAGQDASVLHIKVVLTDADRKPMPVPGHALLISHNPATAEPQRVLTRRDGSADVPLGPGSYTVESDTPVVFNGKAYGWTQIVNIAPGHDAVLELTADNAEITSVTPGTTPAAASLETDDSLLAARWQAGVLTLWTATARASSALIGADGLVVTSRKVVGTATTIEVQVTPAIKVPGTVIVADAPRDVAVLRIDPTVVASVPPVPLVCTPGQQPKVASGQKMFGIDAPLNRQKSTISGTANRTRRRCLCGRCDGASEVTEHGAGNRRRTPSGRTGATVSHRCVEGGGATPHRQLEPVSGAGRGVRRFLVDAGADLRR
jgi:hypothetical protein